MEKYDAIIIGAGPAGLSAAAQLRDYNVLLIDKVSLEEQDRFLEVETDVVRQYGLDSCVANYINTDYYKYGDREFNVEHPNYRAVIDYHKFVNIMRERGKFKFEQREVKSLEEVKDRGKIVICADGAKSKLAKEAGVISAKGLCHRTYNLLIKPKDWSFLPNVCEHYQFCGKLNGLALGAEVYVYPRSNELIVGAGAYCSSRLRNNSLSKIDKQMKEKVLSYLKGKNFDITSEFYGNGTTLNSKGIYHKDNIIFTGECVGQVEPIYMYGFHSGLYYGEIAGKFVIDYLNNSLVKISNYDSIVQVEENELYSWTSAGVVRVISQHGINIFGKRFLFWLMNMTEKIYKKYGYEVFLDAFLSKKRFWHNAFKYLFGLLY